MRTFDLYVPRAGSHAEAMIDAGSAIVGSPAAEWLGREWGVIGTELCIDYEGNRYGAQNMVTLADRAVFAAGRHRDHYPTKARMVLAHEELIRVGSFDLRDEQITVEDSEALAGWLGTEDFDYELHGTSIRAVRP